MLTRIFVLIILLIPFSESFSCSKDNIDLAIVQNFFNELDKVRVDFKECHNNIDGNLLSCVEATMYITKDFNNKAEIRLRIDYKDQKNSIVVANDALMYCDHALEEVTYFSEDILLVKLLTASEKELSKLLICEQSEDKIFVFQQYRNRMPYAKIKLSFDQQNKLNDITITKEDEDSIIKINQIKISKFYNKEFFSMRNPYSFRKKNR